MGQAKRNAIAELRRACHTPADIAKVLNYPKTTVYDVCKKKYDRSCNVPGAPHKPKRDRKLTPRFLNGMKRSTVKRGGQGQRGESGQKFGRIYIVNYCILA